MNPSHFLSVPGLAWQACLKKRDVGLRLLTDVDMLLMAEKGIRGAMCHSIHRHAKANKYIRDYKPNRKKTSYLMYWDKNNLHVLVMSQRYPVEGFA